MEGEASARGARRGLRGPRRLLAWLALLVAVVYVLNPGMGLFELLPDNLPGVGNLDEAAAVGLIIALWQALRRRPAAPGAAALAARGGDRVESSPLPRAAGTPEPRRPPPQD